MDVIGNDDSFVNSEMSILGKSTLSMNFWVMIFGVRKNLTDT